MTNIDQLRKILDLEQGKGYADRAVIGGLDAYFHRQAARLREDISDSRLLAEFDALGLTHSNYASRDAEDRRQWIARICEWLNGTEEAAREEQQPLPTRKRAPRTAAPRSPARNEDLDAPVTSLKGITAKIADKLARLNVRTVRDLLYFFPRRYVDYSEIRPISELREDADQTVTGVIWQARVTALGSRRGTEAIVGDRSGTIRAVWFNQPYLARTFRTNARVVMSGAVSTFKGQKVMVSPAWELLGEQELIHTARLVPIYPLTQGLYPRQLRKWTKQAVDAHAPQIDDFLPAQIKRRHSFPDLGDAISQMHYPPDAGSAEQAKRRLAFDELLLLQLGVLAKKRDWQEGQPANAFHVDRQLIDRFLGCLPFSLTAAQQRVLQEVLADVSRPNAMSRLLQGDVGSGKTVVATLSLLIAAANGYQGALMAPTEILAEQHFNNICSYFSQLGGGPAEPVFDRGHARGFAGVLTTPLRVALLTGSLSESDKELVYQGTKEGTVDIVIGTHALIQRQVEFKKLGLAVIDEQHRFGVLQRSALRQKGFNPHVLVMTATPIPRTMALTVYGDLDLSVIDEPPPGRQQVRTYCLREEYREKVYDFVRGQVKNGGQAFIICPLVEESEALEARAATKEYERLSQHVFPDLRLGLLHGQMQAGTKDDIMRVFRDGGVDVLVSTSVIEVGIDVPRASVIVIEGAERFGLSQLHQLRGRVGRDREQGYCFLISEKCPDRAGAERQGGRRPERGSLDHTGPGERSRLELMEQIHDGFALAEEDLKLRGPGEFFGTQQSGLPDLRVARLSDLDTLQLARREALDLCRADPELEAPEHEALARQMRRVWSDDAEWS